MMIEPMRKRGYSADNTVSVFANRTLIWKAFAEATIGAVRSTAMILLTIGFAASLGLLLAFLKVPAELVAFVQGISDNSFVILLMINIGLLVLGTFKEMSPLIVICTPPLRTVLFVGCAVGKISIWDVMRSIGPFYVAALCTLMFVAFIPALSLRLPALFR